jgi:hypothetical protein
MRDVNATKFPVDDIESMAYPGNPGMNKKVIRRLDAVHAIIVRDDNGVPLSCTRCIKIPGSESRERLTQTNQDPRLTRETEGTKRTGRLSRNDASI